MGMFDDLIPAEPAKKADPKIGQPEELTWYEKWAAAAPDWMSNFRGTAPGRVLQGMADLPIGVMQTAANVLPDSTGIPEAVNKRVADIERDYEGQRKERGSDGVDWWRIGGQVVSPANAALARAVPVAAVTNMGRAAQGAGIGAAGAAMQPVVDDSKSFWGQKAEQGAVAAGAGAVLGPALGKVGDAAVKFLRDRGAAAASTEATDVAIMSALKEMGQTIHDIPPAQLETLRDQVAMAVARGKQADPAALLRQADFDRLGMQGTQGQVTRDPMQWAREQNLRGVEGVGQPLAARFNEQGKQLSARLPGAGEVAQEAYPAGRQLAESLKGTDDVLSRHVSGLYREARESAGKDMDIPLQGLAQDYANVLRNFGERIPPGVRNAFEDLGLISGNQKKVFNFEGADRILKTINENVSNDPGVNNALGQLRGALRSSLESVDSSGGPFAPAVKAARERFALHDAVPALQAAARGEAVPDTFVRGFIINGKTDEVRGMADVLRQSDPQAFAEARAQLAAHIRRAAFGENAANDAAGNIAPTTYAKTLRQIGSDKLRAFFSPQELDDFQAIARVAGYMKQEPAGSAPNRSNTAGAAANIFYRLPKVGPAAKRMVDAVDDSRTVKNALARDIQSPDLPLNERQRNALRYWLYGPAVGGGLAGGSAE